MIASNGTTRYAIVLPDAPTPVDHYAAKLLASGIKATSGATVPVVAADAAGGAGRIYLGMSAPALQGLGRDPMRGMQEQSIAVRTVGDAIYLYGKGVHGNLYAVVDFLDSVLGRVWAVDYEKPRFERVETLLVPPQDRRRSPSFVYRMLGFPSEFSYQYGYNICLTERVIRDWGLPEGTMPAIDNPVWVHTSFLYMPPDPGRDPGFEWLKTTGYFNTHPEFYSQDHNGRRLPSQLCYGSDGMRAQLTTNILEHLRRIRLEKKDDLPILIALDQEDAATGKLCLCPACAALDGKYRSNAGGFFDYVIELGHRLKAEQPDVLLKVIAYRRSQTQVPPALPRGITFPDNVVVVFCGVEDVINKTWKDPENRGTYDDLRAWARLTPHVWVWNYYLYSAGLLMPFSNIERMALDMQMARQAGAEAVLFEMYPEGGLTDLLQYLYLKLSQDVDADVKLLVRRFCEAQYGPAAAAAEAYVWDVESASRTGSKDMAIIHPTVDFEGPFSYLTDERINRWQGSFGEMDRLVGEDERLQKNVRRLRRSLDFATLGKWRSLAKAYPDVFTDYTIVRARIGMLNSLRAGTVEDWVLKIRAGDVHQPLPAMLNGVPKERIREFVPVNNAGKDRIRNVLDPDAAFGYATIVSDPDVPFTFGFHPRDAQNGATTIRIEKADVTCGVWKTYTLGRIQLTPNCLIWFSSRSWMTQLELGGAFQPDGSNLFDAYVSLKFKGAAYGGEGEPQVLCDRIILVKAVK